MDFSHWQVTRPQSNISQVQFDLGQISKGVMFKTEEGVGMIIDGCKKKKTGDFYSPCLKVNAKQRDKLDWNPMVLGIQRATNIICYLFARGMYRDNVNKEK